MLFLTLYNIRTLEESGIYSDLLREFRNKGHEVFCVSPIERSKNYKTELIQEGEVNLLNVRTLNIQKTNLFEKVLSTLTINYLFKRAIKKYFKTEKFDLILYSTPPITFANTIKFLKVKNKDAKTYLLLKDIFPQNAVDLGLFNKKSIIYKYFRTKEVQLYNISDFIGCMSKANIDFLIKNNPQIDVKKIEENPNSINCSIPLTKPNKVVLRKKLNLPMDETIFIYGGNLGKPQAIPFIKEVLDSNKNRKGAFFIIIGSGTEKKVLDEWFSLVRPQNCLILNSLPKNEYNEFLSAADVGLIFLDYRFTIPNFPSRLLSYLQYELPVIAAVDNSTDIGRIAVANNFGTTCASNNLGEFNIILDKYIGNQVLINEQGKEGLLFLNQNYASSFSYNKIVNHFNSKFSH